MSLRVILIAAVIVGAFGFLRGADSQQQAGNAGCKNTSRLQYRSTGAFTGNGTSEVKCTVDYWICNQMYSQSKVVKNAPGACDSFRDSVVAALPQTACCDCYPNCNIGNNAGGPGDSDNQPQKSDCCGDVQQLKNEIKQLEDQVRDLQKKLNGSNITLGSGGSKISITNDGVSINSSGDISIKASGDVTIKGARVRTN